MRLYITGKTCKDCKYDCKQTENVKIHICQLLQDEWDAKGKERRNARKKGN